MTRPIPSSQSPAQHTQHVPSAFPVPGAVAPATFTPTSVHAASPSHASTSAANALSAPYAPKSAPAPAPAPAAAPTDTATPAQPPLAATALASGPNAANPKILPYLFDDAHIDDVLVLVVDMLVKLTEHNDSLPLHPSALTRFHSRATPNISLSAYLRRIAKYTSIEKCCVLILLVYIDRVCERLQGFTICGLTVHRFICAAILCASKALCDAFNTNEHYAKVGGISLQEINLLEKEFLQIIDWRLICSGAVLQHYYASLVRSHKDYALAEPKQVAATMQSGRSSLEAANEDAASANGRSSNSTTSISGSSNTSSSGASGNSASRASSTNRERSARTAAGSVNATPAMAGTSQHSSPFPISSSSASPFTPAVNGGLVAATTSSASGSGSSRSPVSAMQVDSEPPLVPPHPSRRRKDEQRTPPSPRGHATLVSSSSMTSGTTVGGTNGSASPGPTHPQHPGTAADAYKRTRFDHPPYQP